MSVAFIFPGQGSQFPGMLHQLLDHPAVVQTLDEISEDLQSDVRTLDTERGLEFTVDVQIALLAAGVATAASSAICTSTVNSRPRSVSRVRTSDWRSSLISSRVWTTAG